MKIDFKDFIDNVIKDLKNTGSDFYEEFNVNQKEFIVDRTKRLALLYMEQLASPNDTSIAGSINAVKNTLLSEVAFTQHNAEQRINKIILNVVNKSLDILFKAI